MILNGCHAISRIDLNERFVPLDADWLCWHRLAKQRKLSTTKEHLTQNNCQPAPKS